MILVLGLLAGCDDAMGNEAAARPEGGPRTIRLSPSPAVALAQAPRFGLNLGGASTWGAEQLSANVLKNPGFEAPIDRSLVVAKAIGGGVVTDDVPWTARPDGLWDGADFEVLTGGAAGRRGKVQAYRRAPGNGAGEFRLSPFPEGLQPADALSVTTTAPAAGVPMWWTGPGEERTVANEVRPGSGGRQSARIAAANGQPGRLAHHLDMLARAGKLLPVTGAWRLAFWARAEKPDTSIAVVFRRHGSPAFVASELVLSRDWRRYELPFAASDDGPYGPLELSFEVRAGAAYLDDAYLGEAAAGPGGFRTAAVDMLRELRPGYLRDWQGQLGDTSANRTADAGARRPTRHRHGEAEIVYNYSLGDFLELNAAVGAKPWVVAPPLMGDGEWRSFGQALAAGARRHGFDEVLVEFGNENWNELFRPAGFMSAPAHAAAADRAFAQLREGAGDFRGIVAIVNAQYVNPAAWGKLAAIAREAQRIAVAPYFLYKLDPVTPAKAVEAAFADTLGPLRQGVAGTAAKGKQVAVYEVNFHATEGAAPAELRDLAVAGSHSGSALARQLLGWLLAGVREQAVYTLAGFDAYTASRQLVRLWGVTRDLAPGRLRPTGHALKMINGVIDGDAHATTCSGSACDGVTAVWFRRPQSEALAVASRHPYPVRVRTGIPCSAAVTLQVLDGADPARNNEREETVRVQPGSAACEAGWSFELPARGVAVLRAAHRPPRPAAGDRR
jgi:hypothetical protein